MYMDWIDPSLPGLNPKCTANVCIPTLLCGQPGNALNEASDSNSDEKRDRHIDKGGSALQVTLKSNSMGSRSGVRRWSHNTYNEHTPQISHSPCP